MVRGEAAWPTGTSSRDAPYFGIEIPDAPGKYFYVWLDAPVGYLASLKNHFDKGQARSLACDFAHDASFDDSWPTRAVEQVHFIGKDIVYFHTLFWPAMLQFSGRKTPNQVYVHGFITVTGEKMSKSRGTGIDPLKYLALGHEPRVAALLHRGQAQRQGGRRRLQPRRLRGPRELRPDRQVHQHREPRGGLHRQALRRQARRGLGRRRGAAVRRCAAASRADAGALRWSATTRKALREIMALADKVNEYVDQNKPWELAKKEGMEAALHDVCTACIEAFRLLTIYLKPVLPRAGGAGRSLPEVRRRCCPRDAASCSAPAMPSATTST